MGEDEKSDVQRGDRVTPVPWDGEHQHGDDVLRALHDSVHDAVMILREGRFVEVNPRALEIFGCTREQILGSTPWDISPPAQPDGTPSERAARERLDAARQGRCEIFEWRHLRPDGSELDTEVSLTPFTPRGQDRPLILAVVRDVTERKRVQQELRAREAHEALVLRSLPMAFYTAYPEGDFGGIWVNEKVAQVSGFSSEHFRENRGLWLERLHPEDRERVLERFRSLKPGDALEVEYRWKHADGRYRWFMDRAALVPRHGSKSARIIGTWLDITRRKETEDTLEAFQQELRSLTARLATAEEEERRRIAVLLHDSAAQDLALALLKLGSLKETLPDSSADVLDEVARIISTTAEELRTLSHDLSPPELNDVGLEAALEALAERFGSDLGIDCAYRDDGQDKPLDRAASTTLFRCTEELLANVVRHADASSVILDSRTSGDHVQVSVTDDGQGFDAQEAGMHRAPNGGFGLFSIRERMEDLGGSFEMRSVAGQGTRAVLRIPMQNSGKGGKS